MIGLFVLGAGFLGIGLLVGLGLLRVVPGDLKSIAVFVFVALLFGSVGAGVTWLAIRVVIDLKREERAQDRWPKQPWRWQKDWAKGEVVHSPWNDPIAWAVFAGLWNALSWFAVYLIVFGDQPRAGVGVMMVMALFCLVGLILISKLLRATWVAWRWGASKLKLKTRPAIPGQCLVGVIETSRDIAREAEILLTLTCSETRYHRGKISRFEVGDGERFEHTLWQASRIVRKRLRGVDGESTRIPVVFNLPDNAKSAYSPVSWTVEARANDGWLDYQAEFEVPVFRVRGDNRNPICDDQAFGEWLVDEEFVSMVRRGGGCILRDDPRSLELHFKTSLSRTGIAVEALVWLGWMCASIGIFLTPHVPLAMRIGFPLLGVFMGGMVISECFRSIWIIVTSEHIICRRRIFGIWQSRQIDRPAIECIVASQERRGMRTSMEECVGVRTIDGKYHLLIHRLPQRVIGAAIAKRAHEILSLKLSH